MWVFCCGMYRSASTLQFQITTELVKQAGIGQQVGWIDADRFAEVRSRYDQDTGLKVIKVHKCTDSISAEFIKTNAIGIYTYRDVRDVYASMMKQRHKSFEFLWNEGFLESCLDNYRKWTNLPNVLVSRYKEIIADPTHEVERIANHLHIKTNAEACGKIARSYTIEVQQERISAFKQKLLQLQRSPTDHREIFDYHDNNTLLHMNHIDSIKTGRWKDDLSSNEVEQIERTVKDWCARYGDDPSVFLT
jgi:hypothetical protein